MDDKTLLSKLFHISDCVPVTLYAPFNIAGLKGNISFTQELPGQSVQISIHLQSALNAPANFSWTVHANPVFYGTRNACTKIELGKVEAKLSDKHGPIQLGVGIDQTFVDSDISLSGPSSIFGRSILLQNLNSSASGQMACANIFHNGAVKTAEAVFTTNIAGRVIFRENELGETIIYSNLFQTGSDYRPASKHDWRILVTDVYDTRRADKCQYLSQLFDPDNLDDRNCSNSEHRACKMGEMTKKHGQITVGTANNRYSKLVYMDTNLPISSFVSASASRQLYLMIYEKRDRVVTCAQISEIREREVKAEISMDGVKGFVRFSQRYRFDPTIVTVSLNNLMGRGKWYHIHEFPVPPKVTHTEDQCSAFSVGGHFNPFGIKMSDSPAPGVGTNDQYELGDLSGKYGVLTEQNEDSHFGIYVDFNLPLFGANSVMGRAIVIHRPNGDRWICSTISHPEDSLVAEATFYFPVVGRVVFRQLIDEPLSETSVYADLSYSDVTVNDTDNHAWDIHVEAPGMDFYNWSRRCNSAGEDYNPFEVGVETSRNAKCSAENPMRCRVGDLTSKSRRLSVASYKGSKQVKLFYSDELLPLSGAASIVGRSLVIHDDAAPTLRGNRMACTMIRYRHPLQATVRRWRVGAGSTSNVSGSIQFSQKAFGDRTIGKLDVHGLHELASGYHVHEVWVPQDKEFPCSDDSVYGHFNPLAVDVSVGPLPGAGTSDQYELGDLSGKFGPLDFKATAKTEFTDSNLPLHGVNSIIGRSVVIHKKEKNARWVCGTITPHEKKENARELVALASFDDPRNLISGFIRFRQYVYKDGSLSTTWLEVDLRYPGSHNRNITRGHDWAIFVNQVGVDAYNTVDSVRCIASGFRWNPYLSAVENVHYKSDCGNANPLRCAMGDLSGKHGQLVIGDRRLVLADDNLPLVGNFSVMHRTLVIHGKNNSDTKLACANIKPDQHLVTTVAVKRHPTFSVNQFMSHMRKQLDLSEWLVAADVDQTKLIIGGECVQLSVHFYGKQSALSCLNNTNERIL